MAAYPEKEEIEFGLKRAVNGPTKSHKYSLLTKKILHVSKASLTSRRQDDPLMLLKHQIPIPEEAGIGSKETEAANKEVEKLQTKTGEGK